MGITEIGLDANKLISYLQAVKTQVKIIDVVNIHSLENQKRE